MNNTPGDKKPRILLIDDIPVNIKVLRELLKNQYSVSFATDGYMGLKLAAQEQPDLILLDVSMPGMHGYEVCKRLKQSDITAHIPVIFVTALADDEDELVGLSMGAIDYITKPLNPSIVLARVKNHIEFSVAKSRLNEAYALLDEKNRELDEKNRILENLLKTDRLTKVSNRLRLDEVLHAELSRTMRYGGAFTIILLDVDHFKRVNDTYGHQFGDIVLVRLAEALAQGVRTTDVVGRWGGEEFLLLCPQTDLDTAAALAERLRKSIEVTDFGTVGRVTASFGVASYQAGDDVFGLLRRADAAMYKAKRGGRNRVESLTADEADYEPGPGSM